MAFLDGITMESATYRVVSIQIYLAIAAAAIFYLVGADNLAKATLYGAIVALVNVLLLRWRMHRSGRRESVDPHRDLSEMYYSSMERFFVVGLLLAVGIGWLKLMPVAVLAAFVVGQLALIISSIASGIEKQ
ncbi:MAG: ATP synthase subunit I [Burkholderiales bacterium]